MIRVGAKGIIKEVLQGYYRDFIQENIFFIDDINVIVEKIIK